MKTSKRLTALAVGTLICVALSMMAQSTAPTIDAQPTSQTVSEGANATFTALVSGSEPLTYQWFFNSAPLTDATNVSLTISNAQLSNAGNYQIVVTNEAGAATSEVATLTISNPPQTFLDFNGDGKADLLWRHPDGRIAAWLMDGTNFLGAILLPYTASPGWKMAGQADFDHDGKFDFLWQHLNGTVAFWFMDGTNRLGTLTLPRRSTGGWRIVGLTDFDDDGNTDIVWQHGNGLLAAWLMDGTNIDQAILLNDGNRVRGGWKIVAVTDVDNDNEDDLIWQHGGGRLAIWYMNGTNKIRTDFFKPSQHVSSSWHLTGNVDLNGDGENDLIWQNSLGFVVLWLLNGTNQPLAGSLRTNQPVARGWTVVNH